MITQVKTTNMKPITLQNAHFLLQQADAVIVEGYLTYPSLYDLTGDIDNDWLCLSWEDEDGLSYISIFTEETEIQHDGQSLFMKDDTGSDVVVTLLAKMRKWADY